MSAAPRASVIIPARNAEHVIDRQLTCLAEQTEPDFEVIVAANGPRAGLDAVAQRWRDRLDLRVVDASARLGCGPARNVGVAAAHSDRLLFCDAGDYTGPTWVAELSAALDEAGLATGAKAIVAEAEVDLATRAEAFARARFSTGPNTAGARPYASGGNSGFRREVLEAIGGFSTHNLRREDVEASWLAQDLGHTLAFVPEAQLLYVARSGARAQWRQHYGYGVGLEALRRQLDPDHQVLRPLRTTAKIQVVRALRNRSAAPAALGSLVGHLSERLAPGRHFERLRRNAGADRSDAAIPADPSPSDPTHA